MLLRREEERKERMKAESRFQRVRMRIKSIARDSREFTQDIRKADIKIIRYKIAKFFVRNYKKISNFFRHAWIEIKKIGNGFKLLKEDLSYSIKTTRDTTFNEYGSYSYSNRLRIRQTWSDFMKFIPFSVFLIIPGLELLLPAWLIIFPNAIPSQFQSNTAKKKKFDQVLKQQKI